MTVTIVMLDAAITANEAAKVDNLDRMRLDSITQKLRRHRRNMANLPSVDRNRYAGINWHGPGLADMIHDSDRIRAWYRSHGNRL